MSDDRRGVTFHLSISLGVAWQLMIDPKAALDIARARASEKGWGFADRDF
jgi:hypothetical protein